MFPSTIGLTEEAIPQGGFVVGEGLILNHMELHTEFDIVEVSLEHRMGSIEGERAASCKGDASARIPMGLARLVAMTRWAHATHPPELQQLLFDFSEAPGAALCGLGHVRAPVIAASVPPSSLGQCRLLQHPVARLPYHFDPSRLYAPPSRLPSVSINTLAPAQGLARSLGHDSPIVNRWYWPLGSFGLAFPRTSPRVHCAHALVALRLAPPTSLSFSITSLRVHYYSHLPSSLIRFAFAFLLSDSIAPLGRFLSHLLRWLLSWPSLRMFHPFFLDIFLVICSALHLTHSPSSAEALPLPFSHSFDL